MRIDKILWAAVSAILASSVLPINASADGVAIQYHFAGAANLSKNTNFDRAKSIFSLPASKQMQSLVLDRLARVYWNALEFNPASDSIALLRPMLDDLLQAESVGSFGGHDKNRMGFVLAARLDARTAASWQKNLEAALGNKGEALTAEGFSGWCWNRPGNNAFWLLQARDWTLAGRGEDLLPVRAAYLQHIKQDNRPAPVVKDAWLNADVDWPLLATWVSLSDCPLKLARTTFDVTANRADMHVIAHITYPQPVPWQHQPWRIPKGLVSDPMTSFTASQNLAAYLNPNEPLSRLAGNPLTSQLYCWASLEMPLQSYAAFPVTDATNTLRKLGSQAPAMLNPGLEARNHTQLSWLPKNDQLYWTGLQLTAPSLGVAHDASGEFLLAKVFPIEPAKHAPASEELWNQFQNRNDLVYYDWELTGLRLMQWRLLTELLPVFPPPTPEDIARRQKFAQLAKAQAQTPQAVTDPWLALLKPFPGISGVANRQLAVTDNWLSVLTPFIGSTVTVATRTSPTELTVERNSQFLFTGLELVLFSHWLADARVGPIDYRLLPVAKMSGPGLPPSQ